MAQPFEDAASLHMYELLGQLLTDFTSVENTCRTNAETQFHNHWLVTQAPVTFAGMAYLLANHPAVEIRSMAAILLRRKGLKLTDGSNNVIYFVTLGEDVRGYIRTKLMQSLANEANKSVRNKVCHATADIAAHMCDLGDVWSDLVQLTIQFVQSPNAEHRETAFRLLSEAHSLFYNEDPTSLLAMITAGLQDSEEAVRLVALKAGSDILINAEESSLSSLGTVVPHMLNIIPSIVMDPSKDEESKAALDALGELALNCSSVFKGTHQTLISFMTTVMKNTNLDSAVRHAALELLLTLAETSRAQMRKQVDYPLILIPILLEWMSEHDDDEDWYLSENLDEFDQSSNETVGEQSMDRVSRNLGGKIVLPIAFNIIPTYLSAPEWPKRHAALRCISAIGEGCLKLMSAELEKVVGLVVPHLADPHPRVRHAACNAIGQMCTDFAPKIQQKFYDQILRGLIPVMSDVQFPRVSTYAAAAMVNFAEEAKMECIAPYLPDIIPNLVVLLNSSKYFSREQAVTTIATVADSCGEAFAHYYTPIMRLLMDILKEPDVELSRPLVGKALECSTLIAMACGKEMFMPIAREFTDALQFVQSSAVSSDDPRTSYLLGAWTRVCTVLGPEFEPFMSVVLPPLFAAAKHVPECALLDADDEDPSSEDGWEVMNTGLQRMAIKTAYIDDKCTAVEMLMCYVKELGPLFHPHVEETMQMILPMFGFIFHDGVRIAAASVVPLLLQSWVKADYPNEKVIALWHTVANTLIATLKKDNDASVVSQLFDTFHDALACAGPTILTEQFLIDLIAQMVKQISDCHARFLERSKTDRSEDADQEEAIYLEEEEEADDTILQSIGNAIHQLFKAYGVHFLPIFHHLVPALDACMNSAYPSERRLALDVYQEMIEFTPAESITYQPHFLKFMIETLLDPEAHVRQTAAFGIGAAALSTGDYYRDICISSMPKLHTVITAHDARSDENIFATENAVSAIGKICQRYGATGLFDVNQVLPIWLQSLPIIEDQEEFGPTYSYLLDLIETGHPSILPEGSTTKATPQLAKIVDVLTQVLAIPGLTGLDGLMERMLTTLRRLLSQCNDETRGGLWNALPDDRKKMLSSKGYF
ncbi:hypothetical protein BATDEDRAFT_33995 [Batrachochytrium dendrobatidis JAM81]|uniref:IPO4/5-like TPR repeats domain-containing protein n=2 Tax=Batrachochytrium dendrobatidis TaxID=109871 RepID=F4NTI3_BATDJ|nr:uncharacterized protein BATDEDRAFT_33995 [Batrachochytrium dendrobatidis JAM81]EGF83115.1 hypothetical protein BATDEDRAFT_33995 [Batrachochytrium dendrobatidis JAM81]KAJ8331332.1 importin subunit beta-3 [Batrachochytrium dendrobatidis]KAK5671781.1 importin subunit beta-3 [Batrachochytrium dendrobatidis]OAJ36221.1 hypothetical protein BDEG_20417 [Batrachochytrium dendrobatidis JEL423]|eukprot:XP_006675716.1 hypothetical protein BATDEDRAFT_33995 [Batrachochytrium dendrobatidis JAM81]